MQLLSSEHCPHSAPSSNRFLHSTTYSVHFNLCTFSTNLFIHSYTTGAPQPDDLRGCYNTFILNFISNYPKTTFNICFFYAFPSIPLLLPIIVKNCPFQISQINSQTHLHSIILLIQFK